MTLKVVKAKSQLHDLSPLQLTVSATTYAFLQNSVKSMCMCVTSKWHRPNDTPSVRLNNQRLEFTDTVKYLHYIVTNIIADTLGISKQMKNIYARSNMLTVKFGCVVRV